MLMETLAAAGMALMLGGVAILCYSSLGGDRVPLGIDDRGLLLMLARSQLMDRARRIGGALIVTGVALQSPSIFFG